MGKGLSKIWKRRTFLFKSKGRVLYLALKDPRVPLISKIVVGLVVAYAFSPIDIIPDFIPFIGWIDDLVILPLGMSLALKLIPQDILEDLNNREQNLETRNKKLFGCCFVTFVVWVLMIVGVVWWIKNQ